MAYEKKLNDKIIFLLMLISIPLIASTNIDCGGKSFHCLNSTHFMICVDLGGGVSTTVDDYVIPCPPPTVCKGSNRFECELPVSSTQRPTVQAFTVTSNIEATTSDWEQVANVTTTSPIAVAEQHMELTTVSALDSVTDYMVLPFEVEVMSETVVNESDITTNASNSPNRNITEHIVFTEPRNKTVVVSSTEKSIFNNSVGGVTDNRTTNESAINTNATEEAIANNVELVSNIAEIAVTGVPENNIVHTENTMNFTDRWSTTDGGFIFNITELALTGVTESSIKNEFTGETVTEQRVTTDNRIDSNISEPDVTGVSKNAEKNESQVNRNATELGILIESGIDLNITDSVVNSVANIIQNKSIAVNETETVTNATESAFVNENVTVPVVINTSPTTANPITNNQNTGNISDVVNFTELPIVTEWIIVNTTEPAVTEVLLSNATEISIETKLVDTVQHFTNVSALIQSESNGTFSDVINNTMKSNSAPVTNVTEAIIGNTTVPTVINESATVSGFDQGLQNYSKSKVIDGNINETTQNTSTTESVIEAELAMNGQASISTVINEQSTVVSTVESVNPNDHGIASITESTLFISDSKSSGEPIVTNETYVSISEPKRIANATEINIVNSTTKFNLIINSTSIIEMTTESTVTVVDVSKIAGNTSEHPAEKISGVIKTVAETEPAIILNITHSKNDTGSSINVSESNVIETATTDVVNELWKVESTTVSTNLQNFGTETIFEKTESPAHITGLVDLLEPVIDNATVTTLITTEANIVNNSDIKTAASELISNGFNVGNFGDRSNIIANIIENSLSTTDTLISNISDSETDHIMNNSLEPPVKITDRPFFPLHVTSLDELIKTTEIENINPTTPSVKATTTLSEITINSNLRNVSQSSITTLPQVTVHDVKSNDVENTITNTSTSNRSVSEAAFTDVIASEDTEISISRTTQENNWFGSNEMSSTIDEAKKVDVNKSDLNATFENYEISTYTSAISYTEKYLPNELPVEIISNTKIQKEEDSTLPTITIQNETASITISPTSVKSSMSLSFNTSGIDNNLKQTNVDTSSSVPEINGSLFPIALGLDNSQFSISNTASGINNIELTVSGAISQEAIDETANSESNIEIGRVPDIINNEGGLTSPITSSKRNKEFTNVPVSAPTVTTESVNSTKLGLISQTTVQENILTQETNTTSNLPGNVQSFSRQQNTSINSTSSLFNEPGNTLIEQNELYIPSAITNTDIKNKTAIFKDGNEASEVADHPFSVSVKLGPSGLEIRSTTLESGYDNGATNDKGELTESTILSTTLTYDNSSQNLPLLPHMNRTKIKEELNGITLSQSSIAQGVNVAQQADFEAALNSHAQIGIIEQTDSIKSGQQTILQPVAVGMVIQKSVDNVSGNQAVVLNVGNAYVSTPSSNGTTTVEHLLRTESHPFMNNVTTTSATQVNKTSFAELISESNPLNSLLLNGTGKNTQDPLSTQAQKESTDNTSKFHGSNIVAYAVDRNNFDENTTNKMMGTSESTTTGSNLVIPSSITLDTSTEAAKELVINQDILSEDSTTNAYINAEARTILQQSTLNNSHMELTKIPVEEKMGQTILSSDYVSNLSQDIHENSKIVLDLANVNNIVLSTSPISTLQNDISSVDGQSDTSTPIIIPEQIESVSFALNKETSTITSLIVQAFAKINNESDQTIQGGRTELNNEEASKHNANNKAITITDTSAHPGDVSQSKLISETGEAINTPNENLYIAKTLKNSEVSIIEVLSVTKPAALENLDPLTIDVNKTTTMILETSVSLDKNMNQAEYLEQSDTLPLNPKQSKHSTFGSTLTLNENVETVTEPLLSVKINMAEEMPASIVTKSSDNKPHARVDTKITTDDTDNGDVDNMKILSSFNNQQKESLAKLHSGVENLSTSSSLPIEAKIYISDSTVITKVTTESTTLSISTTEENTGENSGKPSTFATNSGRELLATKPAFVCQGRVSGRYADNHECRKFYICSGTPLPIVGLCPFNTVFSDIRKLCTRNLSHCIRENQFHCVSAGRFADFSKPNVYYICVSKGHSFMRFKLQCQNGYYLNKTTVRCYRELESSSVSISTDNSQSTSVTKVKKKQESKKNKKKPNSNEEHFECKKEGKFADSDDCRKYYICSKSGKSHEFKVKVKHCDSDEVFNKKKKKCVDSSSYECS